MANTTFSGPVRSQNGFQNLVNGVWTPVGGGASNFTVLDWGDDFQLPSNPVVGNTYSFFLPYSQFFDIPGTSTPVLVEGEILPPANMNPAQVAIIYNASYFTLPDVQNWIGFVDGDEGGYTYSNHHPDLGFNASAASATINMTYSGILKEADGSPYTPTTYIYVVQANYTTIFA